METLRRDLRLGWRHLFRNRGFAATSLLTLALGIGATAAMLSVVDAVLLHGLPYKDSSRLVVLTGTFTEKGEVADWPISQKDFADWRRANRVFDDMSVFNPGGDLALNLEGVQEPERLSGELASWCYFPLLGLAPERGRFFSREEDSKPFTDYVAVLSHDLWERRFGGDPGVLGQALQLNGRRYRVVGIAPPGFRGLDDHADLWIPSQLPPIPEYLDNRLVRWVNVVARLAPGVAIEQAQQQMNAITAALALQYPDTDRGMGVHLTSLRDYWYGDLRRGLLILTMGAGIILTIACVNVANLLLTRAVAEQRGYAISMALGAARGRLVRQLLTESLLLASLGAALGLLLARWATPALLAASGIRFQSWVQVSAGRPEVLAAIVAVAALAGIAFGLVPVWITFQSNITQSLSRQGKEPPRGSGRRRFQSAVIVAQVALALILAAGAGLMAKGYQGMVHQDLGFKSRDLLTYRVDIRGPRYRDDDVVRGLVASYLDQLPALPGVAQVAIANPTIPTDGWSGAYISVEGQRSDAPDGTYPAMMHAVSADYFAMLGIPLFAGRDFGPRELKPSGVLVSRAMADRYWPGRSPLGKRLKRGTVDSPNPWLPVLGVVGNVKDEGVAGGKRPAPDVYFPVTQFPLRLPLTLNFLVRPRPGAAIAGLMPALRRQMKAVNPDLAVFDAATLRERLDRQAQRARFQIVLIGLFSTLALLLAAVGIYGVVAYNVAQGAREIAIRMSMGADRAAILRLVMGRGAALAGIGLAVGLAALLVLGRELDSVLYQTSARDPFILAGACGLLLLVALAANYLPARRAAKLEPAAGLRPE
jgi:putative ABC transport system permease protein